MTGKQTYITFINLSATLRTEPSRHYTRLLLLCGLTVYSLSIATLLTLIYEHCDENAIYFSGRLTSQFLEM